MRRQRSPTKSLLVLIIIVRFDSVVKKKECITSRNLFVITYSKKQEFEFLVIILDNYVTGMVIVISYYSD